MHGVSSLKQPGTATLSLGCHASIKRYQYDSKTLTTGQGEKVVSYAGLGKGHNSRSILCDLKKAKMYVSCGSESNATTGEGPLRAALNEYNPDGSGHRVYSGFRCLGCHRRLSL